MSSVFLLVHGAWHGGWCWKPTEDRLRVMGHDTHAPTLTGLGERCHLAHPGINADTHVQDILNVIRWRELDSVILVGHSYGGMVITGVASEASEKISKLVYLDAFAPEESGVSIFADANPDRLARFESQTADGGYLVDPDLFDAWTDDPALRAWLVKMCTPHPIECFRAGVTLSGKQQAIEERHYIVCDRNTPSPFQAEFQRICSQGGWITHHIDAKHDAMVDQPEDLAGILHQIALFEHKR